MFRKFSDYAHCLPLKLYDNFLIIGHGLVNCVIPVAYSFCPNMFCCQLNKLSDLQKVCIGDHDVQKNLDHLL